MERDITFRDVSDYQIRILIEVASAISGKDDYAQMWSANRAEALILLLGEALHNSQGLCGNEFDDVVGVIRGYESMDKWRKMVRILRFKADQIDDLLSRIKNSSD